MTGKYDLAQKFLNNSLSQSDLLLLYQDKITQ